MAIMAFFASDTAEISLDRALTLNKYWWKDQANKDKYSLSLTAKDARHLVARIYKDSTLVATKKGLGQSERRLLCYSIQ